MFVIGVCMCAYVFILVSTPKKSLKILIIRLRLEFPYFQYIVLIKILLHFCHIIMYYILINIQLLSYKF
jgi:hypothetical protein